MRDIKKIVAEIEKEREGTEEVINMEVERSDSINWDNLKWNQGYRAGLGFALYLLQSEE